MSGKKNNIQDGDEYDVQIEGIGSKGDGIAKIEGFVVIVPKTSLGQNVRIKITKALPKLAFAEVVA